MNPNPTHGWAAAEDAERYASNFRTVYLVYVIASGVGGYIAGYAASATTTIDGSGVFASTTTTHSLGVAFATAAGAVLFAIFSGLALAGIAWVLDGQAVLLRGNATEPVETVAPESASGDGTM